MIKETVTGILGIAIVGGAVACAVPQSRNWILDKLAPYSQIYQEVLDEKNDWKEQDYLNKQTISLLQETISQKNAELATKNENIETLTTEKSTLQTQLANKQSELTVLNSTLTTLRTEKQNLEVELETERNNVETLTSQLAEAQTNAETVQAQLNTANENITNIQSQLTTAQNRIEELENKLQTATNNAEELQEALDAEKSNAASLTSQLQTAIANAENLQTNLNTANENVANIQSQLETANTTISTLNTNLENKDIEISNLEEEIQTKTTTITNLEAEIATLTATIQAQQTEIETLQARVAELEGMLNILPFTFLNDTLIKYKGLDPNVVIPATYSLDENGYAYEGTDYELKYVINNCFENNNIIQSVEFPNGVRFNSSTFEGCSNLTDVKLPEDLVQIADKMFKNCTSLESITLPNTITTIYAEAFAGCTNLQTIYFNGTEDVWQNVSIIDGAIPDGVNIVCLIEVENIVLQIDTLNVNQETGAISGTFTMENLDYVDIKFNQVLTFGGAYTLRQKDIIPYVTDTNEFTFTPTLSDLYQIEIIGYKDGEIVKTVFSEEINVGIVNESSYTKIKDVAYDNTSNKLYIEFESFTEIDNLDTYNVHLSQKNSQRISNTNLVQSTIKKGNNLIVIENVELEDGEYYVNYSWSTYGGSYEKGIGYVQISYKINLADCIATNIEEGPLTLTLSSAETDYTLAFTNAGFTENIDVENDVDDFLDLIETISNFSLNSEIKITTNNGEMNILQGNTINSTFTDLNQSGRLSITLNEEDALETSGPPFNRSYSLSEEAYQEIQRATSIIVEIVLNDCSTGDLVPITNLSAITDITSLSIEIKITTI